MFVPPSDRLFTARRRQPRFLPRSPIPGSQGHEAEGWAQRRPESGKAFRTTTPALRPGTVRPGVETSRPGVARAGAWTDTGWAATMESAVRSGRAAAQHLLSKVGATVTA